MGERFHFGMGEGAPDGKAGVVTDHGIAKEEGGEEPNTESGEAAANEIDTGGAEPTDARHLLEHGEGVLFREVMEGEAAESEVGRLVAERKLPGISLNKEDFLVGWRGPTGDLEGLELEIDGDNGHGLTTGLRDLNEVATMIAITGCEVDEEEVAVRVGQFTEDGFDGFSAAKIAIEAFDVFEVAAQGLFVLIGQVHQLGPGVGKFALHRSENA